MAARLLMDNDADTQLHVHVAKSCCITPVHVGVDGAVPTRWMIGEPATHARAHKAAAHASRALVCQQPSGNAGQKQDQGFGQKQQAAINHMQALLLPHCMHR
jgi:hypothetical protein